MSVLSLVSLFWSFSLVLGDLYCDDELECYNTKLSDYDINCRGFKSCYYDTIVATNDLDCEGSYGCYYSNITAGNSVYCNGNVGCGWTDITNDNTVYCGGRYGCYFSVIVTNDIYCNGRYSCYATTMEADDDIYCDGQFGCYLGMIQEVNELFCDGDYGCYCADIHSSDYLYCRGFRSCYVADIESSPYIYGLSYQSLSFSDIKPNQIDEFDVYLYGYRSGYYTDIYCESGSDCYVYCGSEQACYSTRIFCFNNAICSYSCDDECDYCPDMISMKNLNQNELIIMQEYIEQSGKYKTEFRQKMESKMLQILPIKAKNNENNENEPLYAQNNNIELDVNNPNFEIQWKKFEKWQTKEIEKFEAIMEKHNNRLDKYSFSSNSKSQKQTILMTDTNDEHKHIKTDYIDWFGYGISFFIPTIICTVVAHKIINKAILLKE